MDTSIGNGSIHSEQARVSLLNGDIFYSPNCSRSVLPPKPPCPNGSDTSPFIPRQTEETKKKNRPASFWSLDVSSYTQPQWWHRAYGWIAFLPLVPIFTSTLFLPLLHSAPRFLRMEDGIYTLEPREKAAWLQLDNKLYQAAGILKAHYTAPMILPHRPWAFGYLRPHRKYGTLLLCLQKSREWFVVWMAILSFLIAYGEKEEQRLQRYPNLAKSIWPNALVNEGKEFGIDVAWVDSLRQSIINSFSSYVPRAGTFLHLPPPVLQPDPAWLCAFYVPVWYPWGKLQASDSNLRHLEPPKHLLQQALAFMVSQPSNVDRHPVQAEEDNWTSPTLVPPLCKASLNQSAMQDSPAPSAPQGANGEPSTYDGDRQSSPDEQSSVPATISCRNRALSSRRIFEFFKERAEANARKIAKESRQEKMTRLDREKKPPAVSQRGKTEVYEWDPDGNGEYIRVRVLSKCREDTLSMYAMDQIRYNPVENEYDCCVDWGSGMFSDDESDQESEKGFAGDTDSPVDIPPATKSSIDLEDFEDNNWDAPPPPMPSTQAENSQEDLGEVDMLETELRGSLLLWFGYTSSIPPRMAPILEGEQERKMMCRIFGWSWDKVKEHQELFRAPFVRAAIQFLQDLANPNGTISPDDWDLNRYHRSSVSSTHRVKFVKSVTTLDGDTLYMFDFGTARTVRWNLALKSASEALVICRLRDDWDERDIARFLVESGVSFHTLQPSGTVLRSHVVSRPSLETPIRPPKYEFTASDYVSYRYHCQAILRHPRGRAALMYGAYIGRIALGAVPIEWVFDGPSGWSMDVKEMVVVKEEQTGIEYIDDRLTEAEKLALIGRYICYTGNKDQSSLKSWYMPPDMYRGSANDHGHWTDYAERHFKMLEYLIPAENVQESAGASRTLVRPPHNQTNWKGFSRSSHPLRKIRLRLEEEAKRLIG